MEDRFDQPSKKYTQKKVSRRSFLKGAAKAVSVTVGTVAVAGALWKNRDQFKEFEDSHSIERLIGKPIPGEGTKNWVTDRYSGYDLILVRKHPKLSDSEILGYTDPGQQIKAQAVYGVMYDSGDKGLGGPIFVNDEGYGKWFEIDGEALVVYDSEHNRIDATGKKVYMAGNFLISDEKQ